jgi:hypothetical protein
LFKLIHAEHPPERRVPAIITALLLAENPMTNTTNISFKNFMFAPLGELLSFSANVSFWHTADSERSA